MARKTQRTSQTPKAYMTQTGQNEWGKTYTVYAWDSSLGIYREGCTNINYAQARTQVKESNQSRK